MPKRTLRPLLMIVSVSQRPGAPTNADTSFEGLQMRSLPTGRAKWPTMALLLGSSVLFRQDATAQELTAQGAIALDPIVITSRKIEEDLQRAPVAVTVEGRESLGTGKTDTIRDIDKQAPNVTSFGATGSSFTIRGVGSQALQGINNEMGVGTFIDDIYVGSIFGVPSFLNDLERVEVVRGSQATLYGKNTIGGAINLVSRAPGDTLGGDVELSYGTDNFTRVRAGADVPLADGAVRTRTFLSYTRQDGYVDNLATGQSLADTNALAGRITVESDIGSSGALRVTADVERLDDDGDQPWAPVDLAFDHEAELDFPGDRKLTRGGTAARYDHAFDNFTFTSITGYRAYDLDLSLDGDFTAGPYDPDMGIVALQQGQEETQWQFSQEFRVTSPPIADNPAAGDIRWKGGLYFLYEDFDGSQFYDVAAVSANAASRNALDSQAETYAVYADFGYFLTDRLEVTGGARYSYEREKATVTISSPSGNFFFGAPAVADDTVTFDDLAPEVGLNYQVTPEVFTYAKISKGYKSGGVSQFLEVDGSVNVFEPETSWSYEAGLKSSLLDDRLRLNAAVFYVDWRDQQSNVFVSDFQRIVANASSASSRGIELEASALITEDLSLRASYGYLDATYDDFVFTFFSQQTGQFVTTDFTGNDIPYSPKHTASLLLDWTTRVTDAIDMVVSPIVSYRSSYTFDPVGTFRQDATTIVDLDITFQADNWSASIWGRNLTDEEYLTEYFLFTGIDYGIAARGATIGASLAVTF
ncbi:MAG: TonB-dependent receptor [Pseudomonadota bacterium]